MNHYPPTDPVNAGAPAFWAPFERSLRARDLAAAFGLAAVLFALFADIFFLKPGTLLSSTQGDICTQFYAWRQFGFGELRRGHLVLWDPALLSGTPFFANFQSALLYPLNWFFLVLPLVLALNLSLVLHLWVAGWGVYIWTSRNGFTFTACLFAGLIYMLGGPIFFHVYAGHLSNLCTMAWAPLLFYAGERLLERPGPEGAWRLAGLLSLAFLGGHIQCFYYLSILWFFYFSAHIFASKDGRTRKILFVSAGILGFVGLTAVQWMAGWQATQEGARQILSPGLQKIASLPKSDLTTLVMPGLFGTADRRNCWDGFSTWWEVSLFCGITAVLLAFHGWRNAPGRKTAWAAFFMVLSLFLALGFHSLIYPVFYYLLPFFKSFRGTYKFDFIFSLFLVYLSAAGLNVWLRETRYVKGPLTVAWVSGLLALAAAGVCFRESGAGLGENLWAIYTADSALSSLEQIKVAQAFGFGFAAVTLFLFSAAWFLTRFDPRWKYAVVLLGMGEVLVGACLNRPSFNPAGELTARFAPVGRFLTQHPGDYRVYASFYRDVRFRDGMLALGGLDVGGSDPLLLKRYSDFLLRGQGRSYEETLVGGTRFTRFPPALGLVRCQYVWDEDDQGVSVRRLPWKPLPRALLVGKWEKVSGEKGALDHVFAPGFDGRERVLLEEAPQPIPAGRRVPGGWVKVKDISTEELEVEARSPQSAILLITDSFSRGWRARPLPESVQSAYQVIPGDGFLRAIPLQAGFHHFILEYRPFAFTLGKWVSIASLLLYGLMGAAFCWRGSRRFFSK